MTIRKSPERKRKRSKEARVQIEEPMQNYGDSNGYVKEEIEKLTKKFEHLRHKVESMEHHKPEVREVHHAPRHVESNDYEGRIENCERELKHFKKELHEVESKIKPVKDNSKQIEEIEDILKKLTKKKEPKDASDSDGATIKSIIKDISKV